MQKELITIYQRAASPLPGKNDPEYRRIVDLGRASNTLIFPEYFTFHEGVKSIDDFMEVSADTLKKLFRLSMEEDMAGTMIVGGTILFPLEDRLFNAAPVIHNGVLIGQYFKRNLFLKEALFLSRGNSDLVIEHPVTRDNWGFLTCADVKNPDYFSAYDGRARYLAIPVASPFLPGDTDEARLARDLSIFQDGAAKSRAVVFKACLTGHTGSIDSHSPVNSGRVQGRSLIATAEAVLLRAPDIRWQGALCYSTKDGSVALREMS